MQNIKLTLVTLLLAFGSAALSNVARATTSTEYLPDVQNLEAIPIEGGVTLSWQVVEGADSYTIYYGQESVSEDEGFYENQLLVENITTYTITDLKAGEGYYFAVAAEDSSGMKFGSQNYSAEVSAVTLVISEVAIGGDEQNLETTLESAIEEIQATEEANEEMTEEAPEEQLTTTTQNEQDQQQEIATTPETLPESGPGLGLFLATAVTSLYAWRRKQKQA